MTIYYCEYRDGQIVGCYSRDQPGMDLVPLEESDPDFVAYKNPPPDAEAVGRERDRRLALGFNYNFGDARGQHHFATSEADMKGWDLVTKLKDVLLQLGDTTSTITISTATGITYVTAPEWNAILLYAGMNFQQPLWQASFALQAMTPIPADYATNPAYWPS